MAPREEGRHPTATLAASILAFTDGSVVNVALPASTAISTRARSGWPGWSARIRAKGRIVNVSSVGGRIAMATYGPYGGTKWALEALSDSLRREVAPLGVDVVVVEPGAVRTKISARAIATANEVAERMTSEQHQRYGDLVRALTMQAAAADKAGLAAGKVAEVIADAIAARRPRTRYAIGSGAAMIGILRLFPDRVVDRILAAALRCYQPRAA